MGAQSLDTNSLLSVTRSLIALRKTQNAFRDGIIGDIKIEGDILTFTRKTDKESLTFIFNVSAQGCHYETAAKPPALLWQNGADLDGRTLHLNPYAAAVYAS